MNQKTQIFVFWFSLLNLSSGWWWTNDEVNDLMIFLKCAIMQKKKNIEKSHNITYLFSIRTGSRKVSEISTRFEDYDYDYDTYLPALSRIGENQDYYYYYLDDDHYPLEDRSGTAVVNPLAALIAPLAGLALIAAASAVSVNPLLLQLTTISRNRRRRQLEQGLAKRAIRQITVLENFLSSPVNQIQSDLLMVNYLQCGELLEQTNHCLELLVCSYTSSTPARAAFSKQEKDVVAM